MTDQITNPAADDTTADLTADLFDDWIGGATIAKRSVTIYAKPGLFAEYEDLQRQLEVIDLSATDGAEMAGSGRGRITSRLSELYDEWIASKSTWTVRMLDDEEMARALEGLVEPTLTEPAAPVLPRQATENQKKSHTIAMQEYEQKVAAYKAALPEHEAEHRAWSDERNLRLISYGVTSIEFADGRRLDAVLDEDNNQLIEPAITVDRLRRMSKKLGRVQVLKLIGAANLTMVEEPEIAPFVSRSDSQNDQT